MVSDCTILPKPVTIVCSLSAVIHVSSPELMPAKVSNNKNFQNSKLAFSPGGGTLGISGWGCTAVTLEPLAYTRASSAEFC